MRMPGFEFVEYLRTADVGSQPQLYLCQACFASNDDEAPASLSDCEDALVLCVLPPQMRVARASPRAQP